MPHKIKASIVGVTGYTGLELLRLLIAHPHVEIAHITSRQDEGQPIETLYPHLSGYGLTLSNPSFDVLADESNVVFLCLPHKTAQDAVAALHGKVKVIDLSADYRLDDAETYETYYQEHKYPELLSEVIYGAPEFHRDAIKGASSVANPGCFALLSQLMLYPFAGNIKRADIMAVTGSSGAGKIPGDGTHHPIRSHNMKSYNINAHRHIPEITRTAQISEEQLNFVPTSGPFTRGIFATAFIELETPTAIDTTCYEDEPFIRLQDNVALANIIGSNYCDLNYIKKRDNVVICQGSLDNLVKGAAGCAIQNMNLMFDIDETEGLMALSPLYP